METVNFIEKFIVFLEDNLRKKLDLNIVFEDFGLEPKSFIHIFESLVGMTPDEYVTRRQMTEIAFEIVEGHRRLIDIIKYYDYRDLESFKSIYKETFNISPYDTQKYFKELPLQNKISFEIVPVDKTAYPYRLKKINGFRMIGVSQLFDINDYDMSLKIEFYKYYKDNHIIDELLKFQNEDSNGIYLFERHINQKIEVMIGVVSDKDSPFDEIYIPTSHYVVFYTSGDVNKEIEGIYQYIFRRWRIKHDEELNCNYSLEHLNYQPYMAGIEVNNIDIQVLQPYFLKEKES